MTPEPYVTADDVAEHLKITRRQVLEMTRRGLVPAHPLGVGEHRRVWRFKISEVEAAIASGARKPSTPDTSLGNMRSNLEINQNCCKVIQILFFSGVVKAFGPSCFHNVLNCKCLSNLVWLYMALSKNKFSSRFFNNFLLNGSLKSSWVIIMISSTNGLFIL